MHEEPRQKSFWRTYVFSLDHKVIGLQYLFTSMAFLLLGFAFILLMRWQLAFPGRPLPLIGGLLPDAIAPGGVMLPALYNQLGAMHGTIMIFLGVVPLGVGFFGNYFLPLQIGAPDMAFPRLNMSSYWVYAMGGVVMLLSFVLPGGPAQSGWTSYPPLSDINPGQTIWLIGMTFLITSSLLGSINFIVTTVNLRAPGLTWSRLPLFVWAQLVTAILLLFAFPVLQSGAILQLLDRVAGTCFYLPMGLVVGGKTLDRVGGGSPLLWQHLFWFLAHPEVYVLVLPAMGIVSEIIAANTRKPLFGYTTMVGSMIFVGVFSFLVWAHHMFVSGMKTSLSMFFMTTTMVISIPSVAILSCLLFSLWGGKIRFTVPMLFALAFLPMFGIGGLTGLPLGFLPTDIYLHDTYYVIGHFHYVVVTGTIIALMAGVYHWFPKMFGRSMDDRLGQIHFWGTLIGMNGIFLPMFIQGLAGMQRRLYDPTVQTHNLTTQFLSPYQLASAILLLLFQIPFLYNFFKSMTKGVVARENPWDATTLEWACPSPPPHGNFPSVPSAHRAPYEYSVPGRAKDFWPQWEKN
ncbi:MAG TPA: cbb3-type cytochrome c oxidase subunit I [Elusimicrobiota bacterium]|jgi:cytochrome c oxidase subunit 1|nr:cbb3-type cytochrome c oxidase subunit I [Elusimicrobiota bacterium]HMX93621.1 cbb3-type cytochrome c oxidase subunit I [Elusimicrobiota bacterium]